MFPWTEFDFTATSRLRRAVFVYSLTAVFVYALFLSPLATAATADNVWHPLVDRLAEDGFDRTYVSALFSRKSLKFSPEIMARKMNVLLETRLSSRKPEPGTKPEVMARYFNPILIAGAYGFYRDHKEDFVVIENRYAVSGEVLTALLLVETKLGTQVGKHNGLSILASMALAHDFELIKPYIKRKDISDETHTWLVRRTGQKAGWAYEELKALISYAQKNGKDPLIIPSSMYGAIGLCQFMPSNAIHYGRDGSGDGIVDLFNTLDALHSMANFMKKHGWKKGLDRKGQLKVVYRYNHSESYAMTILAVADKIRRTNAFFGN
ncbi:MAG: lytic murein transglycosylase [Pseudodesulfovibrio sp.]|nr:lytic murein transglycosylase [Pseudodesulfovibrio sp.]